MSASSPAHQHRVTPSSPTRSPSMRRVWQSSAGAVPLAARLGRLALLRSAAGAAHDDPVFLDELAWVSAPVLVALQPATRIAFAGQGVRVALLLVRPMLLFGIRPLAGLLVAASFRHGGVLPRKDAVKPPHGPDSAADAATVRFAGPRRLVAQDAWFSARRSRVRIPPGVCDRGRPPGRSRHIQGLSPRALS